MTDALDRAIDHFATIVTERFIESWYPKIFPLTASDNANHVTQPSVDVPATITLSNGERIEVDQSDFLGDLRHAFRRITYHIAAHILRLNPEVTVNRLLIPVVAKHMLRVYRLVPLFRQSRPSAVHGDGPDLFANADDCTAFEEFVLAHYHEADAEDESSRASDHCSSSLSSAPAHAAISDRAFELQYARSLLERLLGDHILPPPVCDSSASRAFIAEVLCVGVLMPGLDTLADPDFLSGALIRMLSKNDEDDKRREEGVGAGDGARERAFSATSEAGAESVSDFEVANRSSLNSGSANTSPGTEASGVEAVAAASSLATAATASSGNGNGIRPPPPDTVPLLERFVAAAPSFAAQPRCSVHPRDQTLWLLTARRPTFRQLLQDHRSRFLFTKFLKARSGLPFLQLLLALEQFHSSLSSVEKQLGPVAAGAVVPAAASSSSSPTPETYALFEGSFQQLRAELLKIYRLCFPGPPVSLSGSGLSRRPSLVLRRLYACGRERDLFTLSSDLERALSGGCSSEKSVARTMSALSSGALNHRALLELRTAPSMQMLSRLAARHLREHYLPLFLRSEVWLGAQVGAKLVLVPSQSYSDSRGDSNAGRGQAGRRTSSRGRRAQRDQAGRRAVPETETDGRQSRTSGSSGQASGHRASSLSPPPPPDSRRPTTLPSRIRTRSRSFSSSRIERSGTDTNRESPASANTDDPLAAAHRLTMSAEVAPSAEVRAEDDDYVPIEMDSLADHIADFTLDSPTATSAAESMGLPLLSYGLACDEPPPPLAAGEVPDLSSWTAIIRMADRRTLPRGSQQPAISPIARFAVYYVVEVAHTRLWRIYRRIAEFYILDYRLREFYGAAALTNVPALPSKAYFRRRNNETTHVYEAYKLHFEKYLQKLLSLPLLRNSRLLYSFLVERVPFEEVAQRSEQSLTQLIRSVPTRLQNAADIHRVGFLVESGFLYRFRQSIDSEKPEPNAERYAPASPADESLLQRVLSNQKYERYGSSVFPLRRSSSLYADTAQSESAATSGGELSRPSDAVAPMDLISLLCFFLEQYGILPDVTLNLLKGAVSLDSAMQFVVPHAHDYLRVLIPSVSNICIAPRPGSVPVSRPECESEAHLVSGAHVDGVPEPIVNAIIFGEIGDLLAKQLLPPARFAYLLEQLCRTLLFSTLYSCSFFHQ